MRVHVGEEGQLQLVHLLNVHEKKNLIDLNMVIDKTFRSASATTLAPYKTGNSVTSEELGKLTAAVEETIEELRRCHSLPADELTKPFNRMHSWEECYEFFQNNLHALVHECTYPHNTSSSDSLLERATLHLSFYLASFGMYRGSTPYLQLSKEVFKEPLQKLFFSIRQLPAYSDDQTKWNVSFINQDTAVLSYLIDDFVNPLCSNLCQGQVNYKSERLREYKVTPLFKMKVFMGIFGALPALDVNVKKGISVLERKCGLSLLSLKKLNDSVSKENILAWLKFSDILDDISAFKEMTFPSTKGVAYPAMRKIDLWLWLVGYNSQGK